MTREERETFLADAHVGVLSVDEPGRGPLSVPVWYLYEPGGEIVVVTRPEARKARLLAVGARVAFLALLDTHNAIVRQELTRHRGREIKAAGDGFLATFDGPARAIRCAAAIHDEIRRLGIEIRAGLHTGECELMGNDIGGIAVHIGARVAGEAEAGDILVSSEGESA